MADPLSDSNPPPAATRSPEIPPCVTFNKPTGRDVERIDLRTFAADVGRHGKPTGRFAHTNDRPGQVRRRTARFGEFVATSVEHGAQPVDADVRTLSDGLGSGSLFVVISGEVQLRHPEMRATLQRRDSALLRSNARITYATEAPARIVLCSVPTASLGMGLVPPSLPFVVARSDTALPSAIGALLFDLLQQDARRHSVGVRHEVAGLLQSMVPDAATVIALDARQGWDRRRQRQAALRYVAAHYTDPDLDSAAVAEHLGISLRGLQRLFEGDGGMTQHIRRLRAQHAIARLQDTRFVGASMADIATLSGFGSALAMRRTIRELTGKVPAELRPLGAAARPADDEE